MLSDMIRQEKKQCVVSLESNYGRSMSECGSLNSYLHLFALNSNVDIETRQNLRMLKKIENAFI